MCKREENSYRWIGEKKKEEIWRRVNKACCFLSPLTVLVAQKTMKMGQRGLERTDEWTANRDGSGVKGWEGSGLDPKPEYKVAGK